MDKIFYSYYSAFKYWQQMKNKENYIIEETETGCYRIVEAID